MKYLVLFALSVVFFYQPAFPDSKTIKVSKNSFKEFVYTEMQISNESIVYGLQFGDLSFQPSNMRLHVAGVLPQDKYLCLQIGHVSGVYRAEAVLKNDDFPSELTLDLPGKKFANLKAKSGEIATLAFTSDERSCDTPIAYLPAGWKDLSLTDTTFFNALVLHGNGALGRLVNYSDKTEAECLSFDQVTNSEKRVVQLYSHICAMPATSIAEKGAFLNVIIETFSGRTASGRIEIRPIVPKQD